MTWMCSLLRAAIPMTRRAISSSSSPSVRLPDTGRHHAGFQHAIFRFHRTVRYCDGFTEVSRRQLFAVQHRLDVFRLNIAAFHQLFTGKANRLFFVSGFTAQEDILRTQFEQVVITLLKAVFQMVAYFLFISIVALCGNQTFGQAGVQAAIQEVGQRICCACGT